MISEQFHFSLKQLNRNMRFSFNIHYEFYIQNHICIFHMITHFEKIKFFMRRKEHTCCNSLSSSCSCFIRCNSCSLARYSTGTTYRKGLSVVQAAHPGRVGELTRVQRGHFQPAHITITVQYLVFIHKLQEHSFINHFIIQYYKGSATASIVT